MSAGMNDNKTSVNRDLTLLAPKFHEAVSAALKECQAKGLDAFVYEGYRSPQLQSLYHARGRTIIPPTKPVTNARSNLFSWHGYCLAVDVISQKQHWDAPYEWFKEAAECFKNADCKWGGDWKMKDLPHFQWGRCKPSPSDIARQLANTQGIEAVWKIVGAA